MKVTSIMIAFLHGFFTKFLYFVIRIARMVGGTTIQESLLNGGGRGSKSINRNHYATECTTSFKISISRGVFEGDINSDCILLQHLQQQLLQQLLQHRCSICCSICCMLHRAIANFGNSIPDFHPPPQQKRWHRIICHYCVE